MATQSSYVSTVVINTKLNFKQIRGALHLDILFG